MNRILLLLLLSAMLTGCGTSHYSAMHSRQIWPTTGGSVPDSGNAVPVYRGWPERPYRVIGVVQFAKINIAWGETNTAESVRLCKLKGGDAVIIGARSDLGLKASLVGKAKSPASSSDDIRALIIKWKSPAEIAEDRKIAERFRDHLKKIHPDTPLPEELLKMIFDYASFLGLDLDSPKDVAALDHELDAVLEKPVSGSGTTDWLFRCSLHGNSLTGSFTETIYGIASESSDGTVVSIDSDATRGHLHFSGQLAGGRLSGVMDISNGALSCKTQAEGSVVPNRISLDCRGENKDVMVRGSFIFLK